MLILIYCFSQKREVNSLLGDVIKHMTPDRAFEQHYPQVRQCQCSCLIELFFVDGVFPKQIFGKQISPNQSLVLFLYIFIFLFIFLFFIF